MSPRSKPTPEIKTSTFDFLLKMWHFAWCLSAFNCVLCVYVFLLLFAEEAIFKPLLSTSLPGRDKLYERLWRLACLISFSDKWKCTFIINTPSFLIDSKAWGYLTVMKNGCCDAPAFFPLLLTIVRNLQRTNLPEVLLDSVRKISRFY